MNQVMRFLGFFFEELPKGVRLTILTIIFLAIIATTGVFGLMVAIAAGLWATQIVLFSYLMYFIFVRDRRAKKAKEELVEKEEFIQKEEFEQ